MRLQRGSALGQIRQLAQSARGCHDNASPCWSGPTGCLHAGDPGHMLGYGELLVPMARLWQGQPQLRRAAWAQGLLSVAFSAFWPTLALMLLQRYQMGSASAGAPLAWPVRPAR